MCDKLTISYSQFIVLIIRKLETHFVFSLFKKTYSWEPHRFRNTRPVTSLKIGCGSLVVRVLKIGLQTSAVDIRQQKSSGLTYSRVS